MFGKTIQVPHIGHLKRGWHKWYGKLPVAGIVSPLELWIEIPRAEPIMPFAGQTRLFADRFEQLQSDFASELFETYEFYKRADLEAGSGCPEAAFAKYLPVHSPADIWRVLKPYRLRLGTVIGKHAGNSYLLIDVDWPNPHYFQLFMEASASGFKYVHTELVG
jgi:hypothetical protein